MAAETRFLLFLACLLHAPLARGAVPVVAAERVYGSIAEEIGGSQVQVTSILHSPAQDPHVFEPSPSAARAVAGARLVIENGAGYDPWMDGLLAASSDPARVVIAAAALARARPETNPHLWYSPAVMRRLVQAIALDLGRLDPDGQASFAAASAKLRGRLDDLDARIGAMRARFQGLSVAATEPVFGPMLDALGLSVRDMRFAVSVMNGTEPRASDIAAIEADLRSHKVRALIYNAQVTDAATQRLVALARQAGVPVVGVSESLPDGETYTSWIMSELAAVAAALAAPP